MVRLMKRCIIPAREDAVVGAPCSDWPSAYLGFLHKPTSSLWASEDLHCVVLVREMLVVGDIKRTFKAIVLGAHACNISC